jgi:SAM-dependent methyltransferase
MNTKEKYANSQGVGAIGLRDYWRMLAKRGPRLPLAYFFQLHLFDLINHTDTHRWMPKADYMSRPENFDEGVLYMSSWTSEVKRAFDFLKHGGFLEKPYTFIDVGCGKGKVCLLWNLLERGRGNQAKIIGIDYYKPLIKIARDNHVRMFLIEGDFRFVDASLFDFHHLAERLIIYMYNPFGERMMLKVLSRIPVNSVLIYNNPIHHALFIESGCKLVFEHKGWHPSACTMIYVKN